MLGAWLGAEVGSAVAVIDSLPDGLGEDCLKGLGAATAASGAVALFHVAGVTPEAPSVASTVGSPHFSLDEFAALEALAAGKRFQVPFYACTSRANLAALDIEGRVAPLEAAGVEDGSISIT